MDDLRIKLTLLDVGRRLITVVGLFAILFAGSQHIIKLFTDFFFESSKPLCDSAALSCASCGFIKNTRLLVKKWGY